MQLTKTIFNSAIFIEKKWVENRLWEKSAFLSGNIYRFIHTKRATAKYAQRSKKGRCWEKKMYHPPHRIGQDATASPHRARSHRHAGSHRRSISD